MASIQHHARHGIRSLQLSSSSFARYSEPIPPAEQPPVVIPSHPHPHASTSSAPPSTSSKSTPSISISPEQGSVAGPRPPPPTPIRKAPMIKATKAAITLTPTAVSRLQALISGPTPQLIRIGVRNKGCAGMAYHLEYVEKPGRFDEVVEQDGVRVLIDSKALFSIIGSEMDWVEDRIRKESSRKCRSPTSGQGLLSALKIRAPFIWRHSSLFKLNEPSGTHSDATTPKPTFLKQRQVAMSRNAPVSQGESGGRVGDIPPIIIPGSSTQVHTPAMIQPRGPSTFTPRVVRSASSVTQTTGAVRTTTASGPIITPARRPSFPATSPSSRRPPWGTVGSVPQPSPGTTTVSFAYPPYLEHSAFRNQLKVDFNVAGSSKGPSRSGESSASGSRASSGPPTRRQTTASNFTYGAGTGGGGYPQAASGATTPSPMGSDDEDDESHMARHNRAPEGYAPLRKITINPEEEVFRLPSRLSESDRHPTVQVSQDGRDLTFVGQQTGQAQSKEDAASARTNFSIPHICGVYYYEVEVLNKGNKGHIGVGFGTKRARLSKLPGWEVDSWGYHGDDGHVFCGPEGPEKEAPYGPKFSTGDVVGCGIDFSIQRLFFTKGGVFLGHVFNHVSGDLYPLVGLRTSHESIRTNFGQYPFRFDIESYYQQTRNSAWRGIQDTQLEWEIDSVGMSLRANPAPTYGGDPNSPFGKIERISSKPPSLPPIPSIRLNVLPDGSLGIPYVSTTSGAPSTGEQDGTATVMGKESEEGNIHVPMRELVLEYLVQFGYHRTANGFKEQCDADTDAENKANKDVDDADVRRLGSSWVPGKKQHEKGISDRNGDVKMEDADSGYGPPGLTASNRHVGGGIDLPDTVVRQKVMEAIRVGQIDMALQNLETHYPEVLGEGDMEERADIGIKLKLRCRKFVEMVLASTAEGSKPVAGRPVSGYSNRSMTVTPSPTLDAMDIDDAVMPTFPLSYKQQQKQKEIDPAPPVSESSAAKLDRALAYGQTLHADYKSDRRPIVQALLKKTSSLVAYVNPLDVAEAGDEIVKFAGQGAREQLAMEVNRAVLGKP
ncbi:hypothetical protein FRB96_006031 [Tulasnella sp. 330]|nr:hypothetical protein FRB96_006031 [Tulasnella sp. 330]